MKREESALDLAGRMVRDGKSQAFFRVGIDLVLRAGLAESQRREKIQEIINLTGTAVEDELECLCGSRVQAIGITSHKTRNYSILIMCPSCKTATELTSGGVSLIEMAKNRARASIGGSS